MLAGLDEVDAVFFEFANAIESTIRTGRSGRCFRLNEYLLGMLRFSSGDSQQGHRCCSIIDLRCISNKPRIILCPPGFVSCFDEGMCKPLILSMESTWSLSLLKDSSINILQQTSPKLEAYFLIVGISINRGHLLTISQSIQDSDNPELVIKPFLFLGLLANYNKFEFRNPYRLRLEDFVNESAIQKIAEGVGSACSQSRNVYVAIQEDVAKGWTVGSTLAYIGLGVLAPSKGAAAAQPKADEMKEGFATL